MTWNFDEIRRQVERQIEEIRDIKMLEAFRVQYLGRKGLIQEMFVSLATAPAEEKPFIGRGANDLKQYIIARIEDRRRALQLGREETAEPIDITLPGVASSLGTRHLITQVIQEVCGIFEQMGFAAHEGPEIETEFNNFTALNIPVDHPSRDAFDTFYLDTPDPGNKSRNLLLRSHTSPVQIRIMQAFQPPIAVVVPGKVYRPDAVDASHSFMFHQIEGLLVDRDIKFSHLKGLLSVFCKRLFSEDIRTRFRPHFFPFTEPSAEVDISCHKCKGNGCSVCGRKGWIEIMGCGMVHPNVFAAVKYPKGRYTGLAFGMGVERMAMLKYGIHDIRTFFENDVRFLKQF